MPTFWEAQFEALRRGFEQVQLERRQILADAPQEAPKLEGNSAAPANVAPAVQVSATESLSDLDDGELPIEGFLSRLQELTPLHEEEDEELLDWDTEDAPLYFRRQSGSLEDPSVLLQDAFRQIPAHRKKILYIHTAQLDSSWLGKFKEDILAAWNKRALKFPFFNRERSAQSWQMTNDKSVFVTYAGQTDYDISKRTRDHLTNARACNEDPHLHTVLFTGLLSSLIRRQQSGELRGTRNMAESERLHRTGQLKSYAIASHTSQVVRDHLELWLVHLVGDTNVSIGAKVLPIRLPAPFDTLLRGVPDMSAHIAIFGDSPPRHKTAGEGRLQYKFDLCTAGAGGSSSEILNIGDAWPNGQCNDHEHRRRDKPENVAPIEPGGLRFLKAQIENLDIKCIFSMGFAPTVCLYRVLEDHYGIPKSALIPVQDLPWGREQRIMVAGRELFIMHSPSMGITLFGNDELRINLTRVCAFAVVITHRAAFQALMAQSAWNSASSSVSSTVKS